MTDPLKPELRLLVMLGSIAVHAEEMLDVKKGHIFDMEILKALLNSPEVKTWLKEMDKMALLPVKR